MDCINSESNVSFKKSRTPPKPPLQEGDVAITNSRDVTEEDDSDDGSGSMNLDAAVDVEDEADSVLEQISSFLTLSPRSPASTVGSL